MHFSCNVQLKLWHKSLKNLAYINLKIFNIFKIVSVKPQICVVKTKIDFAIFLKERSEFTASKQTE